MKKTTIYLQLAILLFLFSCNKADITRVKTLRGTILSKKTNIPFKNTTFCLYTIHSASIFGDPNTYNDLQKTFTTDSNGSFVVEYDFKSYSEAFLNWEYTTDGTSGIYVWHVVGDTTPSDAGIIYTDR